MSLTPNREGGLRGIWCGVGGDRSAGPAALAKSADRQQQPERATPRAGMAAVLPAPIAVSVRAESGSDPRQILLKRPWIVTVTGLIGNKCFATHTVTIQK